MSAAILKLFDSTQGQQPGRWSVDQIVAAYLDSRRKLVQAGAYQPKSMEKATRYCTSYADRYGALDTADSRRTHLQDWIVDHPEWQATFTRRDAVGSVVTMFLWAADALDVRIEYRRPRFLGPPVQPRRSIDRAQFQAVRRAASADRASHKRTRRTGPGFRAMLRFLWSTGCRPKEAREAEWTMIDWRAGTLTIERHKTAGVTGEPRVIPVRRVLRLLRWLQRRRRPGQTHVFVNTLGRQWSCDRFAKEFRRFASIAGVGLEISAYCCRHGLCSRLIEAGVGERQVADVLGHKSTRYVSWYAKSTRSKADHLNATLAKDRRQ